jgi:hypothetical protein
MISDSADGHALPAARSQFVVEELLAQRDTKPIETLDDLVADTFSSDEELNEFIQFTHAERRGDFA